MNNCLISFGEALWDIIDGVPHVGGAPFNLAAHAAQLGVCSYLISGVGDDQLGRRAVSAAAQHGVKTDFVAVNPAYPTGAVEVSLSECGQPAYRILGPAAWDFIEIDPKCEELLREGSIDYIYFGSLAQRGSASNAALRKLIAANRNAKVFYDVNLRQNFFSRSGIEWSLEQADIVKMNAEEAVFLSEMLFGSPMRIEDFILRFYKACRLEIALITLGAEGSLVFDGDKLSRIYGEKIDAIDAVGAGDAFSACFLTALLRGKPPHQAAFYGNILGGYVASRCGAVPKYTKALFNRLSDICNSNSECAPASRQNI